jgi:hypothetical protein
MGILTPIQNLPVIEPGDLNPRNLLNLKGFEEGRRQKAEGRRNNWGGDSDPAPIVSAV